MQKILLLFTVFCCTFILGQTFSWVKQFKSYTDYEDAISEMEKDDNGNIYLLGKTLGFSGIDVDPGPATNLLIQQIIILQELTEQHLLSKSILTEIFYGAIRSVICMQIMNMILR